MEMEKVLSVGFKIIMGLAAGIGVVVSLNQLTKEPQQPNPSVNPDKGDSPKQNGGITVVQRNEESPMLQNVHAAQEFCNRASLLVNSAVTVAENLQRVFSKDPHACSGGYNPPYYSSQGGYPQNMGNGWTRQSPFIVEAPGNPNGYWGYGQYRGM